MFNEQDTQDAMPPAMEEVVSLTHTNDDALESRFRAWSESHTPEASREVLASLNPTIEYTLGKMGVRDNPSIEAKARLTALNSLKRYDPSKNVPLPAFVGSQLQSLTRAIREQGQPIRVPDRFAGEMHVIQHGERELTDTLGRVPTLQELRDHTGMSTKKITQLRHSPKLVSQGQAESGLDDESEGTTPAVSTTDYLDEALEYVYMDLPNREKRIMEHTIGYGGVELKDPAELSGELGLSQSQVSRIKAKIANRVNELVTALEGDGGTL